MSENRTDLAAAIEDALSALNRARAALLAVPVKKPEENIDADGRCDYCRGPENWTDDCCCAHPAEDGYLICTRPKGHAGEHIACRWGQGEKDHAFRRWPQTVTPPEPPAIDAPEKQWAVERRFRWNGWMILVTRDAGASTWYWTVYAAEGLPTASGYAFTVETATDAALEALRKAAVQ